MSVTVDKITKEIEKLENKKRAVIAREKEKERKERTHRLIQMGAIVETRLGIKTVEGLENYISHHMSIQSKTSENGD